MAGCATYDVFCQNYTFQICVDNNPGTPPFHQCYPFKPGAANDLSIPALYGSYTATEAPVEGFSEQYGGVITNIEVPTNADWTLTNTFDPAQCSDGIDNDETDGDGAVVPTIAVDGQVDCASQVCANSAPVCQPLDARPPSSDRRPASSLR